MHAVLLAHVQWSKQLSDILIPEKYMVGFPVIAATLLPLPVAGKAYKERENVNIICCIYYP